MSLTEIVLDIETIGYRYDEYCSTFPDKVTINEDGSKETKKKPGLSSIISEIVCVGIYDLVAEHASVISRSQLNSEKEILQWFYEGMKASPDCLVVTYNGEIFDIPVLIDRAANYRIPLKDVIPGPKSVRHRDIYALTGGKWAADTTSGSLSEKYWEVFGEAKETDGAQVADWAKIGDYKSIDEHCIEDITKTARLFNWYRDVRF